MLTKKQEVVANHTFIQILAWSIKKMPSSFQTMLHLCPFTSRPKNRTFGHPSKRRTPGVDVEPREFDSHLIRGRKVAGGSCHTDQSSYLSTCRVQNPDILLAGCVWAHVGVAGRGLAGLFANRTVPLGNIASSHSPKHQKTRILNIDQEAQTSKILSKQMVEQNVCLKIVSSAGYQQFIIRTRNALSSWLPTSGAKLLCLCQHFACEACLGNFKPGHKTVRSVLSSKSKPLS